MPLFCPLVKMKNSFTLIFLKWPVNRICCTIFGNVVQQSYK